MNVLELDLHRRAGVQLKRELAEKVLVGGFVINHFGGDFAIDAQGDVRSDRGDVVFVPTIDIDLVFECCGIRDLLGVTFAVLRDHELDHHLPRQIRVAPLLDGAGELALVAVADLVDVPPDHLIDEALVPGSQDDGIPADASDAAGGLGLPLVGRLSTVAALLLRAQAAASDLRALGADQAADAAVDVAVERRGAEDPVQLLPRRRGLRISRL